MPTAELIGTEKGWCIACSACSCCKLCFIGYIAAAVLIGVVGFTI